MPQDPQIGDSFRIALQAFERKCFLEKNSVKGVRILELSPKLMKTQ